MFEESAGRRRVIFLAVSVVVALGWTLANGQSPLTLFEIGKPDGTPQGFGLSDASYHNYAKVYPSPVVFDVGKGNLKTWPFIHPSTHDTWAHGSKAHTFTINFTVSKRLGRFTMRLSRRSGCSATSVNLRPVFPYTRGNNFSA